MADTDIAREPSTGQGRIVSASVAMTGIHPGALLHLGRGMPRGFWAREGNWVAHAGVAATIVLQDEADPQGRFGRVWSLARELASSWDTDPDRAGTAPRFFGGFSFNGDHREDEAWAGFPAAHFVLPSIEMVGGQAGGFLTVRSVLEEGSNPEETERRVVERLRALRKGLDGAGEAAGEEEVPASISLEESVEEEWAAMVERGLSALSPGGLRKVVLARVLAASFSRPRDPIQVGVNLWRQNPGAYVFLFEPRPGRVLLGAAPETVATVSGGSFRATAVAGSIGAGGDPLEQQSLAASLLGSEKDLREHRMCVEDMVERLSSIATEVQADPEPHVLTLSSIQHLEAGITARLNKGETVLSALEALHPTPAVCGFPRDPALRFLRDQESFQRGWYSGPVGWFDTCGNGEFVPALRSAVGSGREWRLFAGAGIVAGSNAVREWAETRIKFHPALKALMGEGVSEDGRHDLTKTWLWPTR